MVNIRTLPELINISAQSDGNESLADIFDQSVSNVSNSDPSVVYASLESIKILLDLIHLNRHRIRDLFTEHELRHNLEKLTQSMKDLLENQFIARKCVQILLSLVTIIISSPSKELSNALAGTYQLALEVIGDNRPGLGEDMVVFLALATQTVHSEAANDFVVQLSIMNQEQVLSSYVLNIANKLDSFNRAYRDKLASSSRLLSFFTDKWKKSKTEESNLQVLTKSFSALFALFQGIRLNRDFIAALTYSHIFLPVKNKTTKQAVTKNVLTVFLEFMSMVVLDISEPQRRRACLLCFLVLNTICGDEYANYLIHSHAVTFTTVLHKRPPGRKRSYQNLQLPLLFINFLDEFLKSNLDAELPCGMYVLALRCLHCLLCYEKKSEYRLDFRWESIWNSLFTLLNCIVRDSTDMATAVMIIYLCLVVFNMFVLYGDCFLNSVTVYDQLYYELLHKKEIFFALDIFLEKCARMGNKVAKESLTKTQNCLDNILSLVHHIGERVDHWVANPEHPEITQEIVYCIIKDNLESLYFLILPSIDHFTEDLSEAVLPDGFFTELVDIVVHEVRTHRLNSFEVIPESLNRESCEDGNDGV